MPDSTTTTSSITTQDIQNFQHSIHSDMYFMYGLVLFLACYLIGKDVIKFIKSWMYIGM